MYLFQLTLHERGVKLDESLYKSTWEALNDDYEGVRLAAVQVVWVLSHLYPERYVKIIYLYMYFHYLTMNFIF